MVDVKPYMKALLPLLMKATRIRTLYNIYFPWIVPLGTLIAIVCLIYTSTLKMHAGIFTYILDDPYIHMAMAKNVVEAGVWGINPITFSSSSSSLLYTLILSFLFLCCGTNPIIPLWVNFVGGALLVGLTEIILKEQSLPAWFRCVCQEIIIFATPLMPVIFTGMEHILHALINLWLVYTVACDLGQKQSKIFLPIIHRQSTVDDKPKFTFIRDTVVSKRITLLIAAILTTSIRYEGMFVILICTGLYFLRRRWIDAGIVLLGGFLPIVVYGIISRSFGWFFFPNSVISKASVISVIDLLTQPSAFFQLIKSRFLDFMEYDLLSKPILLIVGFGIVLSCIKGRFWAPFSIMNFILFFSTLAHCLFGRFWSVYRYEAYLVVLAYVLLGIVTRHLLSQADYPPHPFYRATLQRIIAFVRRHSHNISHNQHKSHSEILIIIRRVIVYSLLIGFVSTASIPRIPDGYISISYIPKASTNIYDQQYQMAQFLRLYFPGEKVAINDIGAIGFYSGVELFDLAGLGTDGVLENVNLGGNVRARLYDMVEAAGVQIAITYPTWFSGPWLAVGSWTISNNLVCGYHTVIFYAVNASRGPELLASLQAYESFLPETVKVKYYYL